MAWRHSVAVLVFASVWGPAIASAQINFPKTAYLVGLGDSVAAGEGALPVTSGYVYDLYDRGVFAPLQEMDFSNLALRGARSWELRDQQAPQLVCAEPGLRPTVVTITAGANDFLRGDPNIFGIATRVVEAINVLLNNDNGAVANPVLDPVTGAPCRRLSGVTILVSNYYSIPHPIEAIDDMLDAALRGFDQALRYLLPFVPVPEGSRVAIVDLYTPSLGRQGLVTIDRRLGFIGPFDFDVHPTNLGHAFIAEQFKQTWLGLP